ncbi:MAG TPA: SCO family protein [Stellaceae bacterium]|nr:SCO family protein [Stellaceae bacterium]
MAVSSKARREPEGQRLVKFAALGFLGILALISCVLVGIASRHQAAGDATGSLTGQIGGKFALVDDNGKPFTDAELKGKWHLVFFGYTHCPDICPTALNDLSLALNQLGAKEKEVGVVFISVDPERDTPAVLKSYVESFGGPVTGLTGTPQEVAAAAKDYHVFYAKHPTAGGGYDMDHSAVIYIMDPQGRFTATFGPDDTPDTMAARLRKLLG